MGNVTQADVSLDRSDENNFFCFYEHKVEKKEKRNKKTS